MPVLTPVELWQHTKRDHIEELFRLKDRNGRDYVLPMTHEETVTFHAKEISSYRQLPQLLYHFAIKERDEPRSRGGLLRLREFVMKDAYSFDRDEAGLAAAFEANEGAYHRMFRRAGLEYSAVQAESGMMGGKESVDFLAPSGSGENTLVTCENGDYRGGSRDRLRRAACPRPPRGAGCSVGGRDPRSHHDRSPGGVPRHRRGCDVEGDARREDRRHARPRSRTRRRSAIGGQAGRLPCQRLPTSDRRRDSRDVRSRWRLSRSGRDRHRGNRRRGAPRGAVRHRGEPRRLALARGRGRA